MPYLINEGYFNLPENWQDSSMNILTPVLPSVAGVNIIITREMLSAGVNFNDYLVAQKRKFRNELAEFKYTVEERCHVDDRPAEYWEFSWNNKGVVIEQLLLVMQNGHQIITLNYTSPGSLTRENREAMRATLLSFQFGRPQ